MEVQRRTQRRKSHEVSVTVSCAGGDVDASWMARLDRFLQQQCQSGLIALERGGSFPYLHFQGVLELQASSIIDIKKQITAVLGWDRVDARPVGGDVCVKKLRNRELDTFVGMLGCCTKDEGQAHYDVRMKNVSPQQLEVGKEMFMLLGPAEMENHVEITTDNVVDLALQYNKSQSRNPLDNSLMSSLRSMMSSGKYALSPDWMMGPRMNKRKADVLWKALLNPQSITGADADLIFCSGDRRDAQDEDELSE